MIVALSAGHYPDDKSQARSYDRGEYGEVMPVLAYAIRHLQYKGHYAYLIGTGGLDQKVARINELAPDCAVEIHLNDASVIALGCETLHYPGSDSGISLARHIQYLLPIATGNKDRGTKPGYYWADGEPGEPLFFVEQTFCPAVIVEPWFIQYEKGYLEDHWAVARIGMAIAQGIINWYERGDA